MTNQQLINSDEFKTEAGWMLTELENNPVEIKLTAPINDLGGCRRYADGINPEWYTTLFNQYHNGKRGKNSRSDIRRCRVIAALNNILKSKFLNTFLYFELVDLIKDRILNGYEAEGHFIPPMLNEDK